MTNANEIPAPVLLATASEFRKRMLNAEDEVARLKKENAELRECLKSCMKAMCQYCRDASPGIVCFHGCEYLKQAKAALEGGNHAND